MEKSKNNPYQQQVLLKSIHKFVTLNFMNIKYSNARNYN